MEDIVVVYLKSEYDGVEKRATGLGHSCVLLQLGIFTVEQQENGEDLEVWGEGLMENEDWVDDVCEDILDRGHYFANDKDAWKNALKLAEKSGYHVANPIQD